MADLDTASSVGEPASGWPAVASVAAGTFLLVAAEFLPIGLLSRLAHDLRVSDGTAGLAVTAPGLVAAFAGPGLTLLAGRIDRRAVVLRAAIADRIRDAQQEGDAATNLEPEITADFLIASMAGLRVAGRSGADRAALAGLAALALRALRP